MDPVKVVNNMKEKINKEKNKLLLSMYKSVERMNRHHLKGNLHGSMAEAMLP
jgi:hypothetical protein